MTPDEKLAFEKRRRGRNRAMLAALLLLVALFYLISIAKMIPSH